MKIERWGFSGLALAARGLDRIFVNCASFSKICHWAVFGIEFAEKAADPTWLTSMNFLQASPSSSLYFIFIDLVTHGRCPVNMLTSKNFRSHIWREERKTGFAESSRCRPREAHTCGWVPNYGLSAADLMDS